MWLLDVNALVALAWDSHVHHAAARNWFAANAADGWATCPVTESGFVHVSANPSSSLDGTGCGWSPLTVVSVCWAGRMWSFWGRSDAGRTS